MAVGCAGCATHGGYEAWLTWENDLFAGRDGHYTNGVDLGLAATPDGAETSWAVGAGQQIYTPTNTRRLDPDPRDRPYAGWSYLRAGLRRRGVVDQEMAITLGVVGPASGAERAQALAHSASGSKPAEGWSAQLRNEPTLAASYRLSRRVLGIQWAALSTDLRAGLEISLGTPATSAEVNARLRIGSHALRAWLTAEGRLRGVGYDVFLDGNLLRRGGPRVKREPVVAEAVLGLAVELLRGLSLRYSHTLRTAQFRGQRGMDQFGSLSLVMRW